MTTQSLGHLCHLTPEERDQLEDCLESFERSWQQGARPAIQAFLPAAPSIRRAALIELICVDQEFRTKLRESVLCESYLREFPELREDEALFLELIRAEIAVRRGRGECPGFEEYKSRFPALGFQLQTLFEHGSTAEGRLADTSARQAPKSERPAEPALGDGLAPETSVAGASDESQADALAGRGDGNRVLADGSPRQLGRYEVRGLLGKGAFGTVLRAHDPELNREVAIKVLDRDLLEAPDAVEKYRAEARALADLDHPCIVPVYDFGRGEDGRCFVVSKFIDGRDLSRVMAEGRMPLSTAARVIADLADALQHAHQRELVHCDIKPANILIDADGKPMLVDFGLAVSDQEQSREKRAVAGTPAYMSPEQVRGDRHRLDGRADIWALGAVLYELSTGRRPFGGETTARVFDEIKHREPKPPRMIDNAISPELERIILRCLSKDVVGRYATAGDLSADLRNWLSKEGLVSSAPPFEPVSRRRWRIAALCAGLVVAVAAAIGLTRIGGLPGSRTQVGPVGPNDSPAGSIAAAIGAATPAAVIGAATPAAIDGQVDLRVYTKDKHQRHGLSIHEPGALPLQRGDSIRVEARLSRPAYAYLVWIGTDGIASPVYPWRPGDWTQPAEKQRARTQISLPEEIDTGWPVNGAAGMETVVLFARESPLPANFDLKSMLSGMPRQTWQSERALVWLEQGELSQSRTRSPRFFDPTQIDDPILKTQKLIAQRLKPYFPLITAVSFANKGQ
jgi:Protein kinase domain